jgi:DNA-binding protein H-NS
MTKNYAQLQKQIAKLEQEAEAVRKKEVAGVVGRIQEAIKHYGLTAADLFPKAVAKGAKVSKAAAKPKAPKKPPAPAKYTDGAEKTWNGVGKRPGWFVAALAAGKTPKDLEIGASKA